MANRQPNPIPSLDAAAAFCLYPRHRWRGASEFFRSTVKTSVLCVCLLAVFQLRAFAQIESDIPPTNRVILEMGDRKPSEGEIGKALVAIEAFLKNCARTGVSPDKDDAQFILTNLKRYRVQFVGLKNKKLIYCNFFPTPHPGYDDHFRYWKQKKVEVYDGGAWFWHIDYDPKTGQCSNFLANGVA